MKGRIFVLLLAAIMGLSYPGVAQIKVKKKVNREANQRANRKVDQGIDKAFDKLEEGIGGLFKKKNKKKRGQETEQAGQKVQNEVEKSIPEEVIVSTEPVAYQLQMNWSKFDFVPGDEVIFEDQPLLSEENGEFPSRWDLLKGQVEIAEVDGQNVIAFFEGVPTIIPYLENSETDYLPDVFTIEFDIYRPGRGNRFFMEFYDQKNQKRGENEEITVGFNYMRIGGIRSEYPAKLTREESKWIHVSIAFTKGKLKMYFNDTRLINIPRYKGNPTGFTINAYFAEAKENKTWFLKNFRIAKGGVKYYDRALQDGKIVCNGIKFDVNKASLKTESIGPINEIYEVLIKSADLNFSIEGHTDGDGDIETNQLLSEKRAKAVMDKLIKMGIDKSRLKSKGLGESNPIAENTTAEGKANNRRVEFIKF
jgi:outer membrane protein OmpA-like peptidoglycan-associated protein